jgi:hypothetical protein
MIFIEEYGGFMKKKNTLESKDMKVLLEKFKKTLETLNNLQKEKKDNELVISNIHDSYTSLIKKFDFRLKSGITSQLDEMPHIDSVVSEYIQNQMIDEVLEKVPFHVLMKTREELNQNQFLKDSDGKRTDREILEHNLEEYLHWNENSLDAYESSSRSEEGSTNEQATPSRVEVSSDDIPLNIDVIIKEYHKRNTLPTLLRGLSNYINRNHVLSKKIEKVEYSINQMKDSLKVMSKKGTADHSRLVNRPASLNNLLHDMDQKTRRNSSMEFKLM